MQLHKQVILEITSKCTPQKSQINAIGAIFPQTQKKILPNIFSPTVERSHITVKNAEAHSIEQEPWRGTSAFTLEKSHTSAQNVIKQVQNLVVPERIWGSVRSGSGLSPEGCNFSRFLKSGFEWLNMFQSMYNDVMREDFTKKSPDHLF